MLSGIDPLLISCWSCLSHDLYSAVEKQTSLSLSELLECIQANATELRKAAALHKEQFIDAGVPISPCLVDLVFPILQQSVPGKMILRRALERSASSASQETLADGFATKTPGALAEEPVAVGSATAEERPAEEGFDRSPQHAKAPVPMKRKRWARNLPNTKAAPVRLNSKTGLRHSACSPNAAATIKPCHRKPFAAKTKSSAARSRKSKTSGSLQGSRRLELSQETDKSS